MLQNSRTLGLLLGLVAVVMFGGSLPATRIAVAHLDPWFVTAARATIAGILAVGTLAVARPRYPREHTARLALISACLVVGFPLMMALASVTVPAAHGSVILGLLPLATTVAAVPLARERPSLFFWILSLAGAALVAAFALRDGNVAIVTGDIFLALSVTLTGVGYTLSGVMSRTMPGWQVIAWALLMALPIAVIATVALWPADAATVPLSSWIGLVYVGAFSQFIGYAFWNVALAIGGVARIGQLQLLQTFVSMGLAALLLGETVDGETIAFALAVVAVVALGRRAAVRTKASSP